MKRSVLVVFFGALLSCEARLRGPFSVDIKSLKRVDPSTAVDPDHEKVEVNIEAVRLSKSNQDVRGNITYYNDVQVEKIVLKLNTINPDDPEPIELTKVIKKPCENILFAVIMRKSFNVDSKCVSKKGTYKFSGISPNKFVHILFHDFEYGDYQLLLDMSTKRGAFISFKGEISIGKA